MLISKRRKTPSQYQLTRPPNNHNPLPPIRNLPAPRCQRRNQPPSGRRGLSSSAPGTSNRSRSRLRSPGRERNNHTLPTPTTLLVIINNHPHPGPVRPRPELDVGPLNQRDLGELQGAVEAGEAVVLALDGFELEVGVRRLLGRGGHGDRRGDGDGDGRGDGWEEGGGVGVRRVLGRGDRDWGGDGDGDWGGDGWEEGGGDVKGGWVWGSAGEEGVEGGVGVEEAFV